MPRILVIDDSTLIRRMLRGALEELGFEVEDFLPVSPLEITERIRAARPDLVVTDYHMPHVDGMQVARMVRRTDPGIPVVVLTAMHDPAVEQILATVGVRHVLHKPMTAAAIAKALQGFLAP
jgi:CheY-like chemotaxis protein